MLIKERRLASCACHAVEAYDKEGLRLDLAFTSKTEARDCAKSVKALNPKWDVTLLLVDENSRHKTVIKEEAVYADASPIDKEELRNAFTRSRRYDLRAIVDERETLCKPFEISRERHIRGYAFPLEAEAYFDSHGIECEYCAKGKAHLIVQVRE